MKKQYSFLFIYAVLLLMPACSDNDPETQELPVPPTSISKIVNAGFEDDAETSSPAGWTIEGDKEAIKVTKGGCEGNYALRQESSASYSVVTQQTIDGLEDGSYDLEFYYKNSGGQRACYISVDNAGKDIRMTSLQVSPNLWTRSIIRGFKVSGGKSTIKIVSHSEAGNWSMIDGIRIKKAAKDYHLLKGGDISQLSYVEQMGGKFYDENGIERDCLELLKENGFNIARLRLYNDPGNPNHSPSNRLPAGIQTQDDILQLSKRAKAAGMQIQLTFHYSDYWTNPGLQQKPHEWENLNYDELKKAMYDFTFGFMTKMKNQGTSPEFVAIGNETNGGLLFPDGDYNSYLKMAELYNTGYDAVKAACPESKVIIHLSEAGNADVFNYYFSELKKHGAKYDIIGASYYPFWTLKTAPQIREWANALASRFDKDIFIMETGYNWNPTLPDGQLGQLSHNGPYQNIYPSTPLGQKNFMLELFNEVKKVDKGRIIGCLYWDPIFIETPGIGWELGADNIVSNTTLFNFEGKLLESIDAFRYNN